MAERIREGWCEKRWGNAVFDPPTRRNAIKDPDRGD